MNSELLNTYPKYDSYKDSRVDWLGDIPEHWNVLPLDVISKIKSISGYPNETLLSVYLNEGVIRYNDVKEKRTNATSTNLDNYQLVDTGDFVLNNQQAWRGSVGVSSYRGIVSPAYIILELSKILESNFANYIFRSEHMIYQYVIHSKGVGTIQRNLYWQSFKKSICLIPPISEQTAIANFLDQKTLQIDQAIELKQQQIERLNEYKQIVIQNAVTKGLDPNVPMKNSGTDWIGDVPDHWEVKAIKRISRVARGASPRPIDDPRYFDDEGEYAWVRIKDVTASNRYLTETTQSLSKLGSLLSVRMQPDEIFLSIAGSVGKPIITKIKACIHDGFVYFPDWNQSEEFLYYIFLSGQPYLGLGKIGTQLNLNSETVGSIKIGLPPIDEQKRIVEYLDIETNKANELIEFQKNQIERLKEYKTILINQAVTGKIKVS